MHRPLLAACLAACWLAAGAGALAQTRAALDQARTLLGRNDGAAAVTLLEEALVDAPESDRRVLIDALRKAYAVAARQAESAGQTRAAETYRENLAVLDRKVLNAGASRSPTATGPKATRTTAPEPLRAPVPLRDPKDDAPAIVGAPAPSTVAERVTAPAPVAGSPIASPDPTVDPAIGPTVTQPPQPNAAAVPGASVEAADTAFRAQRYDEAGRIYAALARDNKLPPSRRDHWAYCRCAEVVRRINANPHTTQEWAAIQAEVDRIRTLSPNNWFGEYLRNLATERSQAALRGAQPGPAKPEEQKVVVRGAAPEEPPQAPPTEMPAQPKVHARTAAPSATAATPPAAQVQTQAPPAQAQAARAGSWQILTTPNFRIMHANPELAQQVARVAEATRDEQGRRWLGAAGKRPWSPKCDLYLYPTASLFSRMTGQPEDSPGFSTMGLNGGQVVARRVNLRADQPNLVHAIVPHEVTHVVLADAFPNEPIPRWADEGLAVMAEPPAEQTLRASDLAGPLAAGRVYRVQDLMTIDYPDGQYWPLYYAQSISLTRYLVELDSPERFVQFLRGCQQDSVDAQLRHHYHIDGMADLQRRWLTYARANSSTATASARGGAAAPAARRE
jgi:hypothetical protein